MSKVKEVERVREQALHYIGEVIDILRECFLILDSDLRVIAANELFYNTFKVKKEETEGRVIFDLGNRQWNIPELKILFTDIIPNKGVIGDYEVQHSFQRIGEKIMCLNAKRINTTQTIILAIEDITEKRNLEKKLAEFATLQETIIIKRTEELAARVKELEILNKAMVERELKMIDLKQEVVDLKFVISSYK